MSVSANAARRGAPLRGLATTASVLMWIVVLGLLAMFASSFTFGQSARRTAAQVGMILLAGGYVVLLGVLVAGIAVIAWTVRARAGAEALSPAPHRMGRGWAIGGWLLPVANLVLPLIVVTDIGRAGGAMTPVQGRVTVWWACWIGAWIAEGIAVGSATALFGGVLRRIAAAQDGVGPAWV